MIVARWFVQTAWASIGAKSRAHDEFRSCSMLRSSLGAQGVILGAVGYVWIAVEVLGLIDALRHSGPDWDYADRNKAFWIIFMVFFGPIFVIPYLFVVRPRFPDRAAREESSPFLKR